MFPRVQAPSPPVDTPRRLAVFQRGRVLRLVRGGEPRATRRRRVRQVRRRLVGVSRARRGANSSGERGGGTTTRENRGARRKRKGRRRGERRRRVGVRPEGRRRRRSESRRRPGPGPGEPGLGGVGLGRAAAGSASRGGLRRGDDGVGERGDGSAEASRGRGDPRGSVWIRSRRRRRRGFRRIRPRSVPNDAGDGPRLRGRGRRRRFHPRGGVRGTLPARRRVGFEVRRAGAAPAAASVRAFTLLGTSRDGRERRWRRNRRGRIRVSHPRGPGKRPRVAHRPVGIRGRVGRETEGRTGRVVAVAAVVVESESSPARVVVVGARSRRRASLVAERAIRQRRQRRERRGFEPARRTKLARAGLAVGLGAGAGAVFSLVVAAFARTRRRGDAPIRGGNRPSSSSLPRIVAHRRGDDVAVEFGGVVVSFAAQERGDETQTRGDATTRGSTVRLERRFRRGDGRVGGTIQIHLGVRRMVSRRGRRPAKGILRRNRNPNRRGRGRGIGFARGGRRRSSTRRGRRRPVGRRRPGGGFEPLRDGVEIDPRDDARAGSIRR